MAKRKSKASHGKDVLDDLLKAAARKSDLDRDKELLVRAANEIAQTRGRRRDPRKVMCLTDRQRASCVPYSQKSRRGLTPMPPLNSGSCKS